MRAKRSRNIACLLALTLGLGLLGAGVGAGPALARSQTSDPAALATLRAAQAITSPAPPAFERLSLAARRAVTASRANGGDATATMVALARALPRLSAADQAQARAILNPSPSSCPGDARGAAAYQTLNTAHFAITYTLTGSNAVAPDVDSTGGNAYVDQVADVLENHVYATEITQMGYTPPLVANGGTLIPIQLCNINTGYYGYCSPVQIPNGGNSAAAACTLRNSYDPPTCPADPTTCVYFEPKLDGSDINAPLEVTSAHEFFHAVQFAQNAFTNTNTPPLWLMEGTAVWMENEVYPNIHDYFQYLPATGIRNPSVPFNITVTSDDFQDHPNTLWPFTVYANFAFFKFLSGWLRDPSAVKEIWDYLGTHPNAAPFTALKAVLGMHHRTVAQMLLNWSIWNTLPPNSYPLRNLYGPVGWWQARTLDRGKRGFTSPTATIRPFADAPVRIVRGRKVLRSTRIRLQISGPAAPAGGYYTYRISRTNGTNLTVTRPIGRHGSAFVIPFNPTISFVAVTLNNTGASRTQRFRVKATVL